MRKYRARLAEREETMKKQPKDLQVDDQILHFGKHLDVLAVSAVGVYVGRRLNGLINENYDFIGYVKFNKFNDKIKVV